MTDSEFIESPLGDFDGNPDESHENNLGDDVYIFPTSFAQKRLWFLDQFDQGSPFYNIPTAVRLKGEFNVSVFQESINEIIDRHETLRTTFTVLDDEPVQVISPELELQVPVIDLTELPSEFRESQALRLADEEARKPFDLSKGPLLRATLIKINQDEHIILLTMHHIVSDGWSMGVLVAEISTLYGAFSRNLPSPLPELPIQYADFAEWQKEWLTGEVVDNQLNYWETVFGDGAPVLELPTDRPRPAIFSSLGGAISGTLSEDLTNSIKDLGRKESTTLFMTLLAGLNVLLYRYSKQDNISIGSPMANRNRAEVEGLIGVFINTLVFKNDLSGNPTFGDFLKRVRETTLGAFAHQDLPFESLVEELKVDRDMSRTPLFQVMLILQNAPTGGQQPAGLSMEAIDIHMGTSTFDLTFSIAETVGGLDVSIEYNSDIFNESTIDRLLNHYRQLLESVVADPNLRINEIPILPESEYQTILYTWNEGDESVSTDNDQPIPIYKYFEKIAQRVPDNIAIVEPAFGDKTRREVTYKELDERANLLAAHLRKIGVGPERAVGICTDRSIEMYVAIFGVLKAGGGYLPIDPVHPVERLKYILDDSGVSILVCQEHLIDRIPENNARVVLLGGNWTDEVAKVDDKVEPIKQEVNPESMVYMTYTSGSTGQSKGVVVQNGNLVNAYLGWEDAYQLKQLKSHLQMANFTFDVFSGDLVRALLSGAQLVICPREWLLDPEQLYKLIDREKIDCAEFVPAVLRHLVDYVEENQLHLQTLRVLACGSDSWYVGEYRRFLKILGEDTRLINSFGLTEATIDSTYFEGSLKGLSNDQMVPIGRPFNNTHLFILDDYLQPVPIGVPGELYVGGLGVVRAYHNRPLLTADKFIPNPYPHRLEQYQNDRFDRLYKTGDLARYHPDGNVEFLGRIDEQLKLRGYRIEPGEIESVLGAHPQVKNAAVLAIDITPGDKRLVAYIEKEGKEEPAGSALRRQVQDRLPDYMVPSGFVILDAMPLNASGKIDRRSLAALPPPDLSKRELASEFVAPATETQEKLCGIWGEVLGLKPISTGNGDGSQPAVGIYDNFFELGGHSLLATQLISRVRETFDIDIALRYIFDAPTVSAFAEHVEIALGSEKEIKAPPITAVERDPVTGLPVNLPPLSFPQQRLWFLDQLEPGSPYYNLPDAVRLVGPLNESVLEKSLNEIVRRHESLRTVFKVIDGTPVQIITPEYEITPGNNFYIPLKIDDLRELPEDKREVRALDIAREEAKTPFILDKGPLLRARLIRMKGDVESINISEISDANGNSDNGHEFVDETPEYIVLLTMHHIVCDNWSSNVLIQELAVLYDTLLKGLPVFLPPIPIQYADFSSWQRNWLQGKVLEAEIDHWKAKLSGLPPLLEIPTDRPRPAVQTFDGEYYSFVLPERLSRQLRKLTQDENVTIFMLLLAAFQTLLYRYSGQEDIPIGTPIANRNRTEIEDLIGFFVNTLVIRGNLSGNPTFRDFLNQIRDFSLDAYSHQDVPFEMIVDALQPERDLSHSPIFQVMFALQSSQLVTQTLPSSGLMLSPVDAHSGTSKFDLTLFMVEEEIMGKNGVKYNISGALEYNTDLFNLSTIEKMMMHFSVLLESIVENPDQPVGSLSILTKEELVEQIILWNKTHVSMTDQKSIIEMIEVQAEKNPNEIAVLMHNAAEGAYHPEMTRITYADMNEHANILAHYLRSKGVKPDMIIGVLLDRSVEMIISILGIMKAGGAYLPLDPTYPQERLAFMLEDSGASLIITQDSLLPLTEKFSSCDNSLSKFVIDSDQELLESFTEEYPQCLQNPTTSVSLDNLAYVIYTSGSTGLPKGTMIVHRGLLNYLSWVIHAYPIAEGRGAPVHSSISFDLTITGLFGPLVSGRSVVLFPEGIGVESLGESFIQDAEDNKPPYSLIKITPAHLQLLGEQLKPRDAKDRTHAFIIGGENLLDEQISFWRESAPSTAYVNEYGPTETVVGCCVYWAEPEFDTNPDTLQAGVIPIGKPIHNTQLYILDKSLQPVPVGVPGELYIGGAGLSRGYLKRPELTAERFIPNPFNVMIEASGTVLPDDNRLYKTGDLARFLPDGNIECLGRIDFQVKIRGFRIELGEIEVVLNQHQLVGESVAWVREDASGKRLIAYIVLETSQGITEKDQNESMLELRKYMQEQLPEYMVPSAFVFLDEIPLTSNGKVDRSALPAPDLLRIDYRTESVPARNPQEQLISNIWIEVLGYELSDENSFISVNDNFFDLGGHSLLATQVISRVRDEFDVEIPLRAIFETPTIAGMALQVNQARIAVPGATAPPILKLERDKNSGIPVDRPPLSFGQQRLWFLDQLDPGKPYYNTPIAVRVEGKLDVAALERSINQIVKRHESLRTSFVDIEGTPVQLIAPEYQFRIHVIDLEVVPIDEQKVAIDDYIREDALLPFDLASGPLLRATVVKINEFEYIVLINMHHIISDDWSVGVLIQEIAVLYSLYSISEPKEDELDNLLQELPIQYADYASWQRNWLQGEVLEAQMDYWHNKLVGAAPILELPLDKPRPPMQTFWGDQITFDLGLELSEGVMRLGRESGTTLFMVLLAVYQILLSKYSQQDDISVGTPIANRTRGELEGLIGFFVNTLVMRTDLSGSPTFLEVLERVRETALGAYAHQDVPFEMLVDSIQPERDMSHSPLFQVMMVLQNAPRDQIDLTSDLRMVGLDIHDRIARFDLTLSFTEDISGISASLEYNTDLFNRESIERMVTHFLKILEEITNNPGQLISEISLLTEAEEVTILRTWNDTFEKRSLEAPVHALFEDQVQERPDSLAILFEDMEITYFELNQKANQLGHYLRSLGVGPEKLVGISLNRSMEMIISMLGVLKAGGGFVPIDPNYPEERISFMVEDSGINVLISSSDISIPVKDKIRLVNVDSDWLLIDEHEPENIDIPISPENLAYVIYTSGSTGRPKGVMLRHRGLNNLNHAQSQKWSIGSHSRVLQFASMSFDASLSEIFNALCYGATLVLAKKETLSSIPELIELLRAKNITTATFPPSLLKELPEIDLPQLQYLSSAGESCSASLARRWSRDRYFYNAYGPTEATIGPTMYEVKELSSDMVTVPIGTPLENTQVYILDQNLKPVPPGILGEICIGGIGLSRGYLGKPEMTAEKFIPNPYLSLFDELQDGVDTRLYRTGDLGRFLPEGDIEFVGRIDSQVKVRGFRIELGEIENALLLHPDIEDCVVIVREVVSGDPRLTSYIISSNDDVPGIPELREYLTELLPDYMIPVGFVVIDEIPLTPNGKVDRNALPAPEFSRADLGYIYVPPRNPIEERLVEVWANILKIERDNIGINDNFFELGGHSLLATQIISRINQEFSISLPLKDLFESPTIASLALAIQVSEYKTSTVNVPPLKSIERDLDTGLPVTEPPLSFAQQRLWFLYQLEPDVPFYNIPGAFRLRGDLDHDVLEASINQVIRRHEVLRTRFITSEEGHGIQVVQLDYRLEIPEINLSDLADDERDQRVVDLAQSEAKKPFVLEELPLIRLVLMTLSPSDHVLLLNMHHIVSDGWSMGILAREIVVAYDSIINNRKTGLPDLPIQYADFSSWQREWLSGEVLDEQLNYWKNQLAGVPSMLELPTDRPRPPIQTFNGNTISFGLSSELSEKIRKISQTEGTTLYITLLAAFQILLFRYSGQPDISVGTPVANRTQPELEELIGFFVNTLVMRTILDIESGFREAIGQVRDVALGAYAHQDIPFEMLVDEVAPDRDISHSPLFQVVFTLQAAPAETGGISDLSVSSVEAETGISKFDLTLTIVEGVDQLEGSIEFNIDLFDDRTIENMISHYQILLERMIDNPDQPIKTINLLSDDEEKQITIDWNLTQVDYEKENVAHDIFDRIAETYPDAYAVNIEGEYLNYRSLQQKSNQLANFLMRKGVGPESLVGICCDRSFDMVIGLMGVLKAGGAYLPLDPTYPPERIAYMVQDSKAEILISQKQIQDQLNITNVDLLLIDTEWALIERESNTSPLTTVSSDNRAYVIYTSGSTGKPKGVELSHRNLCNFIQTYIDDFNITPATNVLQFFSFSFDGSIADIFSALLSGGTITMPERDTLLSMIDLHKFLQDQKVNHVLMTPSALAVLPTNDLPDLTNVLAGGEACTHEVVRRWRAGGRNIINAYGPTEATVASTWHWIDVTDDSNEPIPIGKPISNTKSYILDASFLPVPVGIPGELLIGGVGVGRGYLNRPELTAAKFIPDPFSATPGARLYRTGDLVRYSADGDIEFLGRIDHQVKVRGFRIELGEIESVILNHPDVNSVVVIAREDTPGFKRLAAYIIPESDERDEQALKDYLMDELPEYMVPTAFMFLDEFPLTASGKIDRKLLPIPRVSRVTTDAEFIAPRTDDEVSLANLWEKLLGIEKVGVNDNFFELGGDSIVAIQMIARAKQAGLLISPKVLFQNPTIEGIITHAREGGDIIAEQGEVTGELPLTPIQKWFFENMTVEPQQWNTSMFLELSEALDVLLLKKTVEIIMHHHDALRLRYQETESGIRQFNTGYDVDIPFKHYDYANITNRSVKRRLEDTAASIQSSLNLADGPLFRVAYFSLGEERPARLLFVFHHLVMDGISWRIFLEDFQVVYGQLLAGQEPFLPEKTTSYKEWAELLVQYAQSAEIEQELRHWLEIGALDVSDLPVDRPDGVNTFGSSDQITVSLTEQETQALLQDVPAVFKARINDVLLTALVRTLSQITGSKRLLIEMEGHGREDILNNVDISRTIGWFTTTYPVMLSLEGTDGLSEEIEQIHDQIAAIPNHGIGFGLLRELNLDQQISGQLDGFFQPQFNFNYLGQFDQMPESEWVPFRIAKESVGPEQNPENERTAQLYLVGIVSGGSMHWRWLYSQGLHNKRTIKSLADAYLEELRNIIAEVSPDSVSTAYERLTSQILRRFQSPQNE